MKAKLYSSLLILTLLFLCSFNTDFMLKTETTPAMDSTAFDFWLGKWNATWSENGVACHGTNTITKTMNNKFIHESFHILDGGSKGFTGESFSVLDKADGKWKQTWIDSDGSYLDFTGAIEGDTKMFERTFTNTKGKTLHLRMRFYNIKKDSFMWDWEKSEDGKTWSLAWQISYTRME
jgi:hypothetical protein